MNGLDTEEIMLEDKMNKKYLCSNVSPDARNYEKKLKCCIVLQALDGGGIESFALSITENINKEKFDVDYLLATDSPHFYDNRVLENGNRIFYTYRLCYLF